MRPIKSFDERRDWVIPGDSAATLEFCLHHFLETARAAMAQRGRFTVAFSGGQTPQALFKELSQPAYRALIDWSQVFCFWSDERSVPPDHQDSNYGNAMAAGLSAIPLLPEHIFRMHAEEKIAASAAAYEQLIWQEVPSASFDLIMLGMGEDGHTASLFPLTEGLQAKDHLVIANYVPQKQTWRLSMTYACIHRAKTICLYVLGAKKAEKVAEALLGPYDPAHLPVQQVGTPTHKALWILDSAAGALVATRYHQASGGPD